MRFVWLPVPLCLSLTATACHHAQDAAGPPEADTSSPTSEPAPEPTPTTGPLDLTTGDSPTTSTSTSATSDAADTNSTSAHDTTSTGAPPSGCGDGIVDPGETCDLGVGLNHDHDSDCTQSCHLAVCGDGLLRLGKEQCDDGLGNNSQTYGGCSEYCDLNPHCGDGELQPEHEECDASAPPLEGKAPCGAACDYEARLAFVTSATYSGQLFGLQNADLHCATAAASMALDNAANYMAWLGDGTTGPATRFTHGLAATGFPYARRDGQILAEDLASLFAEGLKVPLDITETGAKLPPGQYAWTNLNTTGLPTSATDHCQAWSSGSYKLLGGVGQVSPADDSDLALFEWRLGTHWTRYTTAACKANSGSIHIYCFED